jgi:hypothetical protein
MSIQGANAGAPYTAYQARSHWYIQHFGLPARVDKSQMEDSETSLGVMVFPPSTEKGRAVWTFCTNGMSERRMPCLNQPHGDPRYRCELVAYAYRDEPWIVELLATLAKYPFLGGSGLSLGHTIPVLPEHQKPWAGYLLTAPVLEPETFNPLPIEVGFGNDRVIFLQVVGLLADELQLAMEVGGPKFSARFGLRAGTRTENAGSTVFSTSRPSLICGT